MDDNGIGNHKTQPKRHGEVLPKDVNLSDNDRQVKWSAVRLGQAAGRTTDD
ncbi:hypothetical protein [Echinicola strongylocentroti]|uniref:hypothetical protein n=1 Tax=Echinicola strongylocentroti TaxID=1795355 RepID=UPI0013A70536|nr:hypothetical protein [Echinicola strongylocentroti]